METMTAYIGESEVDLEYNYYPGEAQSWDCPGEAESVEIESIKYEGKEIDVNDNAYEQLIPKCLEDYEEKAEEAYVEYKLSCMEEY